MIRKIFNCISIHNGGGIIYLSMMHSELDKKGNLILLDYRAKNNLKPFLNAEIKFYKKNIFRNLFILKERLKSNFIFRQYIKKLNRNDLFCEYFLNGIPPMFRFSTKNNKVFVLFQNRNLFSDFNFINTETYHKFNFYIYHFLHKLLIEIFLKRTDKIIVQTKSMKKIISRALPENNIIIQDKYWKKLRIDFYHDYTSRKFINKETFPIIKIKNISKISKLFFYPASFDPHKNHKRLFKSFERLSKNNFKNIKLLVTIESHEVPENIRSNKQILFIGNQSIKTISDIYNQIDFLIFPSLCESLGLPLIEASLNNIPIVASDLDFVYDVCKPDYTFNPYSDKNIYEKILEAAI